MRVLLSWDQLNACRQWGTARHKRHLVADRTYTKAGHLVGMPAIGWRTLADRLAERAFHPSGRHRKADLRRAGSAATRSALHRIENALATVSIHPALRGEQVVGDSGEVFIVWPAERGYSLFPTGVDPVYLVPHTRKAMVSAGGPPYQETITTWRAQQSKPGDIDGAFLDPEAHLGWDGPGPDGDHR